VLDPCERDLRGRGALLLGDLADPLHDLHVALEVLALEARVVATEVALRDLLGRAEATRQEATTERAVGDEADAELAGGRQDRVLHVARPQRVLGLERGDRMHLVRAPDRLGRSLRQAQVANLALIDQLRHRADGLLDRDLRVDAVLVVEVDRLDSEPLERRVARRVHVLGVPAYSQPLAVLAAGVPELRRQHHLVATAGDRAAHQDLVREGPVHVGGVKEVDPQFERAVDRGGRLLVVGLAVELGHAHAAEPLHRDLEPLGAELARLHHVPPGSLIAVA
jgi:hypothetical protein